MNAYIASYNIANTLYENPAHADVGRLSKYETAELLAADRSALKTLASSGIAYRGTPARPRLEIVSATHTVVVLTDCGLISATHPYEQYNTRTGQLIKQQTFPHPPPYLHLITVTASGGAWKVSAISTDSSKTCTR